jgi:hypothetical protein
MEPKVREWLEMVRLRTEEMRDRAERDNFSARMLDALDVQLRFIVGVTETLRALGLVTEDEWREWAIKLTGLAQKPPEDADFADPAYAPPVNIAGRFVRLYEERIASELRSAFASMSAAQEVELRGEHPDTEIVVHSALPGAEQRHWSFSIWRSGYADDASAWTGTLSSPVDMVSAILSDWQPG